MQPTRTITIDQLRTIAETIERLAVMELPTNLSGLYPASPRLALYERLLDHNLHQLLHAAERVRERAYRLDDASDRARP